MQDGPGGMPYVWQPVVSVPEQQEQLAALRGDRPSLCCWQYDDESFCNRPPLPDFNLCLGHKTKAAWVFQRYVDRMHGRKVKSKPWSNSPPASATVKVGERVVAKSTRKGYVSARARQKAAREAVEAAATAEQEWQAA